MSSITVVDGADVNIDINAPSASGISVVSQPTSTVFVSGIVAGRGDSHFSYDQGTPESVWVIQHNLGKKPSVTVVDSADSVVIGEIEYLSLNSIKLTFAGAFSGKAYFN